MGMGTEAMLSDLRSLIASEKVADRIKILPPVPYDELLDWTASADIGLNVLPPDYSLSIRWCLPNKLFEYLMAGLPVLTSELDAVVAVVKANDVGWVLSSLAPVDVGGAINSVLVDRVALERMRCHALRAAQSYCWENERQHYIRLYQEILAKSGVKECATGERAMEYMAKNLEEPE